MNQEPTTPETIQPRHNRLDLTKTIKLIDWIREHEAAAMEQPDTKLTSQAQLELGFKITVPNFVRTREGLGIQKARPPEPPTEMEALSARVAALEVALQILRGSSKHEQRIVPEPVLFSGEFLSLP